MARKKKNRGDESSGADIGVVMTCSLFLIILTFFILLNSIAVIDDRRQRLAIGSLVGSFGSLTGGLSPLKTGTSIMPSAAPVVKQELDFQQFLNALDATYLGNMQVITKKNFGIISLSADDLIDRSTHLINPVKSGFLNDLAGFIRKGSYPVEIIAHTDNRPAESKGYRSNWEATALMANQVMRYFVEQGRIQPKRVTAYGRGSQKPITSNATMEARRLNRRIEIKLNYNMPTYASKVWGDRPAGNFTYKRFNFKVF